MDQLGGTTLPSKGTSLVTTKGTTSEQLDVVMHKQSNIGYKETVNKQSVEYDWEFLESQMTRISKNKSKYPPYNWMKPIDINTLKDALFRHTLSVMKDEYTDEGVELDHLAAIALNAMFIYRQLKNK